MQSNLRPSCFSVRDNAANRLSFAISRWTNFERMVLETMNEHKDPITVAEATINQLQSKVSKLSEKCNKFLRSYTHVQNTYPTGKP